jgi:hypothetical protein
LLDLDGLARELDGRMKEHPFKVIQLNRRNGGYANDFTPAVKELRKWAKGKVKVTPDPLPGAEP